MNIKVDMDYILEQFKEKSVEWIAICLAATSANISNEHPSRRTAKRLHDPTTLKSNISVHTHIPVKTSDPTVES